jgi:hypothetical protein
MDDVNDDATQSEPTYIPDWLIDSGTVDGDGYDSTDRVSGSDDIGADPDEREWH